MTAVALPQSLPHTRETFPAIEPKQSSLISAFVIYRNPNPVKRRRKRSKTKLPQINYGWSPKSSSRGKRASSGELPVIDSKEKANGNKSGRSKSDSSSGKGTRLPPIEQKYVDLVGASAIYKNPPPQRPKDATTTRLSGRRSSDSTQKSVESQPRENRRERLITLARPKELKTIWITSQGPRVMWGTQDMLWPVTGAARSAEASGRVVELASPKKVFQTGVRVSRPEYVYSCGRSSVLYDVSPLAMRGSASERVAALASPKQPPKEYRDDRPQHVFSCGRSSPIWGVKEYSGYEPTPRLEQLSTSKPPHSDFVPNRMVQTQIPIHALNGKSTSRLEALATPKNRPEGPFREPQWPVALSAKKASANQRCVELAKAKGVADGYVPNREEALWHVSRGAKRATASGRVNELAVPIIRATMDHVQFDPDAFLVSQTALKGICSKRVEELAQPNQR
ncbi:sperm microtubule associated protein 2-like [Lineus longissimus]|uniref:sperm microtubule associated protein 2-like n=1 Tax=Lineus longissimus TaxID=88925 RepID=UPI00315D2232